MKFCTNCGAEIADNSKFCSNCGTKYEETKSEYDEMWGSVLAEGKEAEEKLETVYSADTSKYDELDIKYEQEPYTESSSYGGKVIFGAPNLQDITQGYEMPTISTTGNGNMGCSIAAMVCGIVSLVCCCFWYFSILLAIAAIVLGIISIKKAYDGKGMAIAGLITGGITIFALIVLLILSGASMLFEW
ncbi:MAG: DUF4190 domain-containing protein [Lachnospiraceae bacterium]|nr:DUF4190 domain-containing protein [Lachnospiraceae bacterium]